MDEGWELLPPRAASLSQAMRDIGYSLETAVADIIDNSITAHAKRIDIRFGWCDDETPWLGTLDDGVGMTSAELVEAMRPGSQNPLMQREFNDLGRFGLGLKTASFSQCRRLTVVSRKEGVTSARCWDLDLVNDKDEWRLLIPNPEELKILPGFDELGEQGTLVLWQKLDRLDLGNTAQAHNAMNERLATVRDHLSLVFHRYIAGEKGLNRVEIRLNNLPVEAFDPFNSKHASTICLPEEPFSVEGQQVVLQPFILPHHSKVKSHEYEKLAGLDGYLRGQGFYIYRNKRLIIHGTWFRMTKQEELTKLARVRVDIPNTLDHLWTIDVRKSRAHPPEAIKKRLRILVEKIKEAAKRPYTYRGRILLQNDASPVWKRLVFNDRIQYQIDPAHPILSSFSCDLENDARQQFSLLLQMIGASFPVALLFSDMAARPDKSDAGTASNDLLEQLAQMMLNTCPGDSLDDFSKKLRAMEPFASNISWIDSHAETVYRRKEK